MSPQTMQWFKNASSGALARAAADMAPRAGMAPKQFLANVFAVIASKEGLAKGRDTQRAMWATVEAWLEAQDWDLATLRDLDDSGLDEAGAAVQPYLAELRGVEVSLKEAQAALDCVLHMLGVLDRGRVTVRANRRAIRAEFKLRGVTAGDLRKIIKSEELIEGSAQSPCGRCWRASAACPFRCCRPSRRWRARWPWTPWCTTAPSSAPSSSCAA